MGIIEDWGITIDDLDAVLSERPSLRGNLIGFLAEYKLQRTVFSDARIHGLKRFDDHDRTRPADFAFTYMGVTVTVEVKSLQTSSVRRTLTGYTVRGVNYFCRLATTISAGEGLANESAVDRGGFG
jgi:hypothetical protein